MGTETESTDNSLILIKQGAEAVSLIHTHWIFRINSAHTHYVKKQIFLVLFLCTRLVNLKLIHGLSLKFQSFIVALLLGKVAAIAYTEFELNKLLLFCDL